MIFTAAAILLFISVFILISSFKIGWNIYLHSICRKETDSKEVVLTFDDGPHPVYTPELLDLMLEKGIKATFFVIGENMEKYPEIVKRMADEGHCIGIHSYNHNVSFTIQSAKAVIEELQRSNTLLKRITGRETSLFRPPFGVTNPNIGRALKFLKMRSVGWSIRSFDTTIKNEQRILKRVDRGISPGAILLLHDRMPSCSSILKGILSILEKKGYKVVQL